MELDLKELEKEVRQKLDDEDLWADAYLDYIPDPYIVIEIEWGDWKHEHLRCDYLIEKYFPMLEFCSEEVTEENGTDCYSATHIYKVKV